MSFGGAEIWRVWINVDVCLSQVIEFGGNGSLTLTIVDVMSDTSKPRKWKLKWYSRDTLLQFVALLKAIHSGWTAAPLTIKCAP